MAGGGGERLTADSSAGKTSAYPPILTRGIPRTVCRTGGRMLLCYASTLFAALGPPGAWHGFCFMHFWEFGASADIPATSRSVGGRSRALVLARVPGRLHNRRPHLRMHESCAHHRPDRRYAE